MSQLCAKTNRYLQARGVVDLQPASQDEIAKILQDPSAKTIAKQFGASVREFVGEDSAQDFDWLGLSLNSDLADQACSFDEAYTKGWAKKHREIRESAYSAEVDEFIRHNKALKLNSGDVIYVQSKSLQQEWLCGKALYIHPDFHVVLMELPPKIAGDRPQVFVIGEYTTLFKIHREIPQKST